MNILYITCIDPRDTAFGGGQRAYFIWEALKKCGKVYTFCPLGGKVPDQYDEAQIHKASVDSSNFFSLLIDRLVFRFFHPVRWPFRSVKYIRSRIGWPEIKFDCVVCRYIDSAALVSAWKLAPRCFIDIDDLPTQSNGDYTGLKKCVLVWWQNYVLKHADVSWLPNKDLIPGLAEICNCRYLPNLAMPPKSGYQVFGKQKRQLMSVGWMAYQPNFEGVDWFVREVWPKVHRKFPELTYVIAGKGAPADCVRRWGETPHVKVLGFVEDLDALYEESLAVVAPVFVGSGTCIKVQEALLHGRHVFATPFAVRGIPASLGIHIGESAAELSDELSRFIANPPAKALCEAGDAVKSAFEREVAESVA